MRVAQILKQGHCLDEYSLDDYRLTPINGFVLIHNRILNRNNPLPEDLVAIFPAHSFDAITICERDEDETE
jgi:hypothetical protein